MTGCDSNNDFSGELKDYYDIIMNNGIEHGLNVPRSLPLFSTAPEVEPFYSAYKSDKRVFDIDDVTVEFYYGGQYQRIDVALLSYSFPSFKIVIVNSNREESIDYTWERLVEENFISEKYNCKSTTNKITLVTEYKFNHSETIKLPRELFNKESGYISLRIIGLNQKMPEMGERIITCTGFYYVIVGGKVILSNNELKLYDIIK